MIKHKNPWPNPLAPDYGYGGKYGHGGVPNPPKKSWKVKAMCLIEYLIRKQPNIIT